MRAPPLVRGSRANRWPWWLLFWFLALLSWRAQELRVIAQSMAEVAVRLAEPEEMARESVVTVGQAIINAESNKSRLVKLACEHSKSMSLAGVLGQVVVHGKDGRIQTEYTYGADPRRSKG